MIITEQQYNSVVSGLRTQLELQRAQTAEKIRVINDLMRERDALRSNAQALQKNCQYWMTQAEVRLAVLKAAVDYAVTGKCERDVREDPVCMTLLNALILAIDRRAAKKTRKIAAR